MKNTRLTLLCTYLFASSAIAGNINCGGKITTVMGGHPSCQGHVAFKTENTQSIWMCSKSQDADSIILAGFIADKSTYTAISNDGLAENDCKTLPHYRDIAYVILNK